MNGCREGWLVGGVRVVGPDEGHAEGCEVGRWLGCIVG